ncbi:hypothetical protein AXF42_Ash016756 [Apostasia shenzhenica]|uniref:Uncharacterized protein n=1 Tax=Apostasia shenzhenica TaxID=1088818 RepID=A0A2I0AQ87_9ASPA|nr:hypothetical protein AXF42_Ash016756 [Apostasia shenzhenica]
MYKMENSPRLLLLLAIFLAVFAIFTEAREIKGSKTDEANYHPQTFPGALGGFLHNPGLGGSGIGSGSRLPGAGFGLPSVGGSPLIGLTVPPLIGSVPGMPGGGVGSHPEKAVEP